MPMIAAFFGPYTPEALTAHVSVFSHDIKRFERLTKLAARCTFLLRCGGKASDPPLFHDGSCLLPHARLGGTMTKMLDRYSYVVGKE